MNQKYLKMIAGMNSNGPKEWTVYMIRCTDGSLYTGVAKDVNARFAMHKCGKGAAYTRIHPPQELVYQVNGFTRSEALIREAAMKRLSKNKKEALAEEMKHGNG